MSTTTRRGAMLAGGALAAMWLVAGGCTPSPLHADALRPSAMPLPHVSTPGALPHGLASFYGRAFHGKLTASGIPFDMNALVAAHPTYPFGTRVLVTNLRNGRRVVVRIVDRGPARFCQRDGVIIDLSRGAAERLRSIRDGRVPVRLKILHWEDSKAGTNPARR